MNELEDLGGRRGGWGITQNTAQMNKKWKIIILIWTSEELFKKNNDLKIAHIYKHQVSDSESPKNLSQAQ